MVDIVTRVVGVTAKGSPLTSVELDTNFINLNQAIVDIVNNLILSASEISAVNSTFTNVGTVEVPIWQIDASVSPRTDSLTNLTSLISGGGELCSANDASAIVQLNGTPGSGTAVCYSPMYSGTYNQGSSSTTFTPSFPWMNLNATHNFTVSAPPSSNTIKAGRLTVKGGSNSSTGNGGDVQLTGGTAGSEGTASSGGGVNILTYNGYGTGNAGNILIQAGSSNAAVNGEGYVRIRANGSTLIQAGPVSNTLGFYNTSPTTKPEIVGSKSSGAALDSLLTALSALGLVGISGVSA
jgi:hypothetical protein